MSGAISSSTPYRSTPSQHSSHSRSDTESTAAIQVATRTMPPVAQAQSPLGTNRTVTAMATEPAAERTLKRPRPPEAISESDDESPWKRSKYPHISVNPCPETEQQLKQVIRCCNTEPCTIPELRIKCGMSKSWAYYVVGYLEKETQQLVQYGRRNGSILYVTPQLRAQLEPGTPAVVDVEDIPACSAEDPVVTEQLAQIVTLCGNAPQTYKSLSRALNIEHAEIKQLVASLRKTSDPLVSYGQHNGATHFVTPDLKVQLDKELRLQPESFTPYPYPNPQMQRSLFDQTILLHCLQPISCAQLAEKMGISPTKSFNCLKEMAAQKLLVTTKARITMGTKHSILYAVSPETQTAYQEAIKTLCHLYALNALELGVKLDLNPELVAAFVAPLIANGELIGCGSSETYPDFATPELLQKLGMPGPADEIDTTEGPHPSDFKKYLGAQ